MKLRHLEQEITRRLTEDLDQDFRRRVHRDGTHRVAVFRYSTGKRLFGGKGKTYKQALIQLLRAES